MLVEFKRDSARKELAQMLDEIHEKKTKLEEFQEVELQHEEFQKVTLQLKQQVCKL